MKLEHKNSGCTIWGLQGFSLRQTMESGQAFRFVPQGQGYLGVVQGRPIYLEQQGDSLLLPHHRGGSSIPLGALSGLNPGLRCHPSKLPG